MSLNAQKSNTNSNNIAKSNIVEKVPIYKGCDSSLSNEMIKKCTSEKISEHIAKHFNHKLVDYLDIEPGEIRVVTLFHVDTNGEIVDVRVKSESPKLQEEAIRVINLIPTFTRPGMLMDKPVIVPYTIPIKLYKKETKNDDNVRFPVHKRCTKKKNKYELKKCTSNKISDYIQMSVNTELANKLFPTSKTTQFQAIFTVDKKGNLKNITAKAHKREMAVEVIKVLKRMPKLKLPATRNGKPIEFQFSQLMTIYF